MLFCKLQLFNRYYIKKVLSINFDICLIINSFFTSRIDKINTNSWFLIANITSGNRNFSKLWKEIQQLLKNKNLNYSFAFTQYSKHEIGLTQSAIQTGFRNIISAGGDGTLHHVVNGVRL
jgi:diacylglycerol kinase (ATP)